MFFVYCSLILFRVSLNPMAGQQALGLCCLTADPECYQCAS